MKILITGASGFVGSHLVDFFGVDHEVYALVRKSEKINVRGQLIKADLLDWESLLLAFKGYEISASFDLIIHAASVTANSGNLDDLNIITQNNLMSFNAARLSNLLCCKRFINISSSSVYPNVNGTFSESSIVNPALNNDAFYGLSKLNSEIILQKELLRPEMLLTHLRCAMIYGDGVEKTRIWPVMKSELLKNNVITVFGNGKRLINQIRIDSLLNIIDKVIKLKLQGVYNVKDETISIRTLAERIIKESGNVESKIILRKDGNELAFILDCGKLGRLL